MSDVMLFGVLKMPYELAMCDELSKMQFYQRVQELIGKYEKLIAELDKVTKSHVELEKGILAELDKQGEPVALMRMPKAGDRVICIEDDDIGTVAWTSAAGGPYINFDDTSYGQWSLKQFGELFRYADTDTAPQTKPYKYDPETGEPLIDGYPLYSGLTTPQTKHQCNGFCGEYECKENRDNCKRIKK